MNKLFTEKDSPYIHRRSDRSDKTVSKFCDANSAEVRRMIGLALEEAVKTATQNHLQW